LKLLGVLSLLHIFLYLGGDKYGEIVERYREEETYLDNTLSSATFFSS
jgi:hypothetical protein